MITLYNITNHNDSQIEKLILSLNDGEMTTLNYLLQASNLFGEIIYPSQKNIAGRTKRSRVTVHRHTNKLDRLGIVKKENRGFKKSCLYYINSQLFTNLRLREKLSHMLSALKWFSKALLVSFAPRDYRLNNTVDTLIKEYNYLKSSSSYIHSSCSKKNGVYRKKVEDFYKKRGNLRMEELKISEVLREVTKKLNLSKWGQIKLSIFRDDILSFALSQYSKTKKIRDVFAWFYGVCLNYAKEIKYYIPWAKYYYWRDHYKMPAEPNYVIKTTTPASFKPASKPVVEYEPINHQEEYDKWQIAYEAGRFAHAERMLGAKLSNPFARFLVKEEYKPVETKTVKNAKYNRDFGNTMSNVLEKLQVLL